jgi:hypothetical protein
MKWQNLGLCIFSGMPSFLIADYYLIIICEKEGFESWPLWVPGGRVGSVVFWGEGGSPPRSWVTLTGPSPFGEGFY